MREVAHPKCRRQSANWRARSAPVSIAARLVADVVCALFGAPGRTASHFCGGCFGLPSEIDNLLHGSLYGRCRRRRRRRRRRTRARAHTHTHKHTLIHTHAHAPTHVLEPSIPHISSLLCTAGVRLKVWHSCSQCGRLEGPKNQRGYQGAVDGNDTVRSSSDRSVNERWVG